MTDNGLRTNDADLETPAQIRTGIGRVRALAGSSRLSAL